MTNFLGFSTGSSSISAGSQLFFQNFQGFTRLVAKSWWKWGLKMAKLLKNGNGSWFFKYFGKKLRNFATGNGNRVQKCLKTLVFEKNARFVTKSLKFPRFFTPKPEIQGFYCVFMWQYFQISSKISQIFFFRSQNPENLRGFCPRNRKWRLLLCFYVTIFGHFEGKSQKKFF